MFQSSESGADVPKVPSTQTTEYEELRHLLFGSINALNSTIHFLHKRGYAEPNDWSDPIPTGRVNEWMRVLTKRIPVED
ncbi:MAG TPA: hypothetical protein V6D29_20185 [Leptolyngbyaceae cyanobacterium]